MSHSVDVFVGKRIRHRRLVIGMTQPELAQAVGVKFQQVQKYETGSNRASASRLWDIAGALDVTISYFFEGMDGGTAETEATDQMNSKETLGLLRAYYAIPASQRKHLRELARVLVPPTSSNRLPPENSIR